MKERKAFVAWQNLLLAQIEGSSNSIVQLTKEIKATRELLKAQLDMLKEGRRDEGRLMKSERELVEGKTKKGGVGTKPKTSRPGPPGAQSKP